MASISTDNQGLRRILFTDGNGNRKTIRLGDTPMKDALVIRVHVERLVKARRTGQPEPEATTAWIADLGDVMRTRLERVGLVAARPEPMAEPVKLLLSAWLRKCIECKVDAAQSTVANMEQAEKTLNEYMGADKALIDVTPMDAQGYESFLRARKCTRGSMNKTMAEATVRRQCRRAKQFFAAAVDARKLTVNPFAKIKTSDVVNKSREHYVTAAEFDAMLDVCPDLEWKLVLSLAYRAGLRCPSETHRLTWGDANWATETLTVHATKTKRDSEGGIRHVPMAPELKALLLEAFEKAQEGDERILTQPADKSNMRTTLYKLMARAGVKRFNKPFQNMRCTCETNWLAAGIPEYQVSRWIGHEVEVSRRHYDQVRAEYAKLVTTGGAHSDARGAQNQAQHTAAQVRTVSQTSPKPLTNQGFCEGVRNDANLCEVGDSPTRTRT